MNTFKQTLSEIESAYQSFGIDSLSHKIVSYELKLQIREYCERNGIKEVVGK